MPDVNPLFATPAAPQAQAPARANSSNGSDAANASSNDDAQQHFANVLRNKVAGNDAPKPDAKPAQADSDKAKSSKDKSKDASTDDDKKAADDPQARAAALLAAAQQQPPVQPDATVAAAAAAAAAAANAANAAKADTAGTGKDATGADTDSRTGAADTRRTTFADALGAGAQAGAAGAAGAKDDTRASSADSTFDTLIGRLRQDAADAKLNGQNNPDSSTSTLAMLMPANQITQAQQAAAVQRPSTLIEAPVGSPLFAEEAAQRVTWLAKSGVEHAEIRVTPPDMGPIQVSIDMKHNEAAINFTVTQTDTRVAVEDSLHRLEAMLADSGISLSQANVNQRDAGQGSSSSFSGGRSGGNSGRGKGTSDDAAGLDGIDATSAGRPATGVRGLVDTFA
jgi:flagellar hook-length control protein FliK